MSFNPLESLIQFATDAKTKLSHKTIVIIGFFLLGIIVDSIFDFSFHYRIQNQLSDLKQADLIIKNPNSDSLTVMYAIYLRDDIINRKNIVDYLSFRQAFRASNIKNTNNAAQNPTKIEPIKKDFWFIFSSGGIFIIVGVVLFFIILTEPDAKSLPMSIFERLITSLLVCGIIGSMGLLLSELLSKIPKLNSDTWVYNYLLNGVLQLVVCLFLAFIINKTTKTSEVLKERIKKHRET